MISSQTLQAPIPAAHLAAAEVELKTDPVRSSELAREVLATSPNALTTAQALLILGQAEYQQGRSAGALDPLLQAYAALKAQDAQKALECALMLGRAYRDLGSFSDASDWLGKALTLSKEVKSPLEAEALNLLAGVMAEQGEYGKALEYLSDALTIARSFGLKEREATILDYIGILYGLYEVARLSLQN